MLRPRDPVTRYRQARLLRAQKHDAAALNVLEAIAAARTATPPTIYAAACVEAARLSSSAAISRARDDLYRNARRRVRRGSTPKDAAQRALTRLSPAVQLRSPRVR